MVSSQEIEQTEVVAAIRATSASRMAHIRERAVDALVEAFYLSDARVMAPGRPEARGHAELRSFWQNEFDQGLVTLNLDPVEIDGAGELAYEIGSYDLMVRREGRGPYRDHGKYVVVYRRRPNGSWGAVADIFNSDGRHF